MELDLEKDPLSEESKAGSELARKCLLCGSGNVAVLGMAQQKQHEGKVQMYYLCRGCYGLDPEVREPRVADALLLHPPNATDTISPSEAKEVIKMALAAGKKGG